MDAVKTSEHVASVYARNIGGIDETSVDIPPGVTVLTGRNATNRTSFLQAIMAAMGSDNASLKGDAEEGHAELEIAGDEYVRTFTRSNGNVSAGGDPYLDDATVADLFAFLLESNDARQAVAQSADLRELIMRPVDTDAIQAEIRDLEAERDRLDDELEELEELKDDLPSLEERRTSLETDIEEKRAELAEKEEEIADQDADVGETQEEKRELESRLDDLRNRRSDAERIRSDIDVQQESIESLTSERRELEAERDDLPETPMGEHQELDGEITRLRQRKEALEADISELQNVIGFNEEMLEGGDDTVGSALREEETDGSVTDQLVADDGVVCWTCGSTVESDSIESTLDHLRDLRKEKLETIRGIEDDLDDLKATQREREEQQRQRENVERRLADVTDELDRRREALESLREDREELNEEIESLEEEVESLESEDFSEILDLHREANQLEFELGRLESDLDDVTDRIATVEDRLAEEDQLRDQRDQLTEELTDLRTRIDQLEAGAIEQFNDHMDAVLGILDYQNLERIWIERVERTVREGRRKVDKSMFELHVVRSTASGATYEDTVDHLSESEREVTGLVFGLAGYLVHDLHETVPFVLLDSLEAIDSERIADLVAYIADYAEFLVVALLPEDAQALDDEYTRITDI
ncbi:archaea-specific SMC-related protein [Halomarina salina]|uniref:Archaea-specific SMC-related protein n=1 Tax=Halomarina salina TaxID=1872699 RepID=A0ABD5RKQ7_9EURY|nr:archaea-specific SMC-related protein [Halomarina salina]